MIKIYSHQNVMKKKVAHAQIASEVIKVGQNRPHYSIPQHGIK